MDQKLLAKLAQREAIGTLRNLHARIPGNIDFCSNDYLGLAATPFSLNKSGGSGSRLISGTTEKVLGAERSIAKFFKAQSALMFNSGYDANLGFFSAIPQRGDTIIYDSLIHASIRDGMRLSFADSRHFQHNDVQDLEVRLTGAKGTVYVVIESLYSMNGDFAPLVKIAQLCEQYGAWLVIDEAHAAGLFGDKGRGLAADLKSDRVLARLITFGKAYGSHGACWLGSEYLIRYLYNFSRSFIYTTALPEDIYQHNAEIIEVPMLNERRLLLQENIRSFRAMTKNIKLSSDQLSPIQIVETGEVKMTNHIASACLKARFDVRAIFPPTVPSGKECLRICLHSFNTVDEISQLVAIMEKSLPAN